MDDDAAAAARAAWEQDPTFDTLWALVDILAEAADLDGARSVITAHRAMSSTEADFVAAGIERTLGDPSLVEGLLTPHLDDGDNGDLAAGMLAVWRFVDGDRSATTIEFLRRGVEHYPDARACYAGYLRSEGRDDEAEGLLRAGVANGEVSSFLPLGNLLDESDRPEEAARMYRAGYELGDAFSAYNLAVMLRDRGRLGEVQEWLDRAAAGGDSWAVDRRGDFS
jgi:TPR repeat protein